jgi:diacylglycerol kinase (ATP)
MAEGHTSQIADNSTVQESPIVFIFVNPKSGGNRAGMITGLGASVLRFTDPSLVCKLYIYDIREGSSGEKPGFVHLKDQLAKKSYITPDNPVRVVVGGGDGTVMWTIQETLAHQIDLHKVAFGVIPFGTGNDFSRATGWGSSSPSPRLFNNGMGGFKALLQEWLNASVNDFDIWQISVKVQDEAGTIKQIKSKHKVEINHGTKMITKPMCNYFSLGIESRIGLGFDKKRTTSTSLNKAMYVWEGFKKLITRTPRVTEIIDSLVETNHGRVIFSTAQSELDPHIQGTPVSMIFLNIPSFAGGCDLWLKAKKLALASADRELLKINQACGDGKVEILTYRSLVGLSLEQAKGTFLSGNGRRLAQESGPLQVNFKPDLANKRTYMQIDGEFFTLDHPEYVKINHMETVKVLFRASK